MAQVQASAAATMPPSAIEARFKSKGSCEKGVPRILEKLEALGRARREVIGEKKGWRA